MLTQNERRANLLPSGTSGWWSGWHGWAGGNPLRRRPWILLQLFRKKVLGAKLRALRELTNLPGLATLKDDAQTLPELFEDITRVETRISK